MVRSADPALVLLSRPASPVRLLPVYPRQCASSDLFFWSVHRRIVPGEEPDESTLHRANRWVCEEWSVTMNPAEYEHLPYAGESAQDSQAFARYLADVKRGKTGLQLKAVAQQLTPDLRIRWLPQSFTGVVTPEEASMLWYATSPITSISMARNTATFVRTRKLPAGISINIERTHHRTQKD